MSDNLTNAAGGNQCFVAAQVDIGATPAELETNQAIDYSVDGILYEKGTTASITFSSGHTTVPVSSSCLFMLVIDSAQAFSTVQGPIVTTADVTAGLHPLEWPPVPDDTAPVGAVRVDTNASTTFVPGTTSLAAAGITDTYYDLAMKPSKPITS